MAQTRGIKRLAVSLDTRFEVGSNTDAAATGSSGLVWECPS